METLLWLQTIQHGHYDEFKKWFDQCAEDPNFDINKVVDTREGAETNLKSYVVRDKMTALNYAAFYGCVDIVNFLLEKGAGK